MAPEPTASAPTSAPTASAAWPVAVMATFLLLITALTVQFVHVTWFAHRDTPAQAASAVQRTALK